MSGEIVPPLAVAEKEHVQEQRLRLPEEMGHPVMARKLRRKNVKPRLAQMIQSKLKLKPPPKLQVQLASKGESP